MNFLEEEKLYYLRWKCSEEEKLDYLRWKNVEGGKLILSQVKILEEEKV